MVETMTTAEVADLLYLPVDPDLTTDQQRTREASRKRMARKRMEQWGVAPIDDRTPRLYPADAVRAAIRTAPGSGNWSK